MTHTPGPWEVVGFHVMHNRRHLICEVWAPAKGGDPSWEERRKANARLIAEAPAMLAALEAAALLFNNDHEACRFCDADTEAGETHESDATCSLMLAAIQRARGTEG